MNLTILVGTMTGTAEMVAQDVRDALADQGIEAEVVLMDGLGPDAFDRGGPFLICTSTYGQGDVPDNAQAFFQALEEAKPDLSAVRYGVIALGDRSYMDTFCHGGLRFDRLLRELGAVRLGEAMLHDASTGTLPEDEGAEWAKAWAAEQLADLREAA
jgi:MioC protein